MISRKARNPRTARTPRTRASSVQKHRRPRTWRLSVSALVTSIMAVVGMGLLTYPTAASWVSQYNQSKVTSDYSAQVDGVRPDAKTQIEQAHAYNDALSAGAVLEANNHVPTGAGSSKDSSLRYANILKVNNEGLMARLKIPSISLDLPVYHGTADDTLLKGLGQGINTHRILLTGERVYPTPAKDVAAAGKRPDVPHFPWWAVGLAAGLIVVGLYLWRAGYAAARVKERALARAREAEQEPRPQTWAEQMRIWMDDDAGVEPQRWFTDLPVPPQPSEAENLALLEEIASLSASSGRWDDQELIDTAEIPVLDATRPSAGASGRTHSL